MKKSIKKSELLEEIRHHYLEEQPDDDNLDIEPSDDEEQPETDDLNPDDPADIRNYQQQRPQYDVRAHDREEGAVNYTGEMHRGMPVIKIRVPIQVSSSELRVTGRDGAMARSVMATKDPRSGEIVDGEVVSDKLIETPNGKQLVIVKNYGLPRKNLPFTYNYMTPSPRGIKHNLWAGIPYDKEYGIVKSNKMNPEVQNKKTIGGKYNYAKGLISKRINSIFNNKGLQDKMLDMFLSPIVGDYRYTEMRTNVVRKTEWGVDTSELKFTFNSIIEGRSIKPALENLMKILSDNDVDVNLIPELDEDFLNDVFDINTDVEPTVKDDAIDNYVGSQDSERKIKYRDERRGGGNAPDYMTRAFPNVYKNGKWKLTQRVGSENEFQKAGGYTPVRRLKSKDIQNVAVSSMSELSFMGDVYGNEYVLNVKYEPYMAIRPQGEDKGVEIKDFITPIVFSIHETLPEGLDEHTFDLGDSSNLKTVNFIVGRENGVLTKALQRLEAEIMNINREKVINTVVKFLMEALEGNTPTPPVQESQKRKIKLTESQVKRLMGVVNEEKFDDMISNFNKSQNDTVPAPIDDLKTMFNIVKDWCQSRPDNSDCSDIMNLRDKLNLY